jgi:hypothetical protein
VGFEIDGNIIGSRVDALPGLRHSKYMDKTANKRIIQLQIDAGAHGDTDLVSTCHRALQGDPRAMLICLQIFADAEVSV